MAGDIIEFGTKNPTQELTQGSRFTPRIEFDAPGGGMLARAGASIPTTTEGKVSFLERLLGVGNVRTTEAGEILIQDPNNPGMFAPFDERGFSFKDITSDLVGPAIEAVPALAAGATTGFVGGAAGGAAGALARTGLSEILTGGETGQTRGEQALEIATTAVLSGAAQQVVKVGAMVVDALRPHNFVARQARKQLKTPFAKKGQRLTEKTGIDLSLGEITGSRAGLMAESFARRTPGGADTYYGFHQGRLRESMAAIQRSMDKLSNPTGSFEVGSDITRAFDDAMESATTLRRAQAAADFGEVHRMSGGQKIISVRSLAGEIQKVVDELDVPGAGDATATVVRQSKTLLKELVGDDGVKALSAEQTARLLSIYTSAQRGTGSVFKDMDKAQSRWVSGRFKDALLRDLDNVASQDADPVIAALRTARDRYLANSDAIREIGDSTLSRLIGNRTSSPEAIAEKFVTRMRPSEVAGAMKIIEAAKPETADSIRRLFIQSALERAKPAITSQEASGVKFSAAKFLGALPDMDVMKAAGFTRGEIVEIGQIGKQLERVADRAFEGSPTAFAGIAWDAIRGLFTLNPVTLGRAAGAILVPSKIAKATLTPEGRAALLTITQTGRRTRSFEQAALVLSAIMATEPGTENVRPLLPDRVDPNETMEDAINAPEDN